MRACVERPNIVSDFDGTITDVWEEGKNMFHSFSDGLAEFLHTSPHDTHKAMIDARERVLHNPGVFGWEVGGYVVAPAVSDPYLLSTASAQEAVRLLEERQMIASVPKDVLEKGLKAIFAESYKKTGTAFRPGAEEFLRDVHAHATLTIVTNSNTEAVEKKLAMLMGADHGISVVGNAKKYMIDPSWTVVAESVKPDGFPRPVYLRRKLYGEILTPLNPKAVIGDVYELDLALPETQGVNTILLTTSTTPTWERAHYENHPHGYATEFLGEAKEQLFSGKK